MIKRAFCYVMKGSDLKTKTAKKLSKIFEGKISKTRYENYKLLYNEINDKKKY